MGLFKSKQEKLQEKMAKDEESLLDVTKENRDYLQAMSEQPARAGMGIAGSIRAVSHRSFFALHSSNTWLFLILAYLVNYMHVSRGNINLAADFGMILIYFGLALLATFVFYRDDHESLGRRLGFFTALTLAAYAVPFVLVWLKNHAPIPDGVLIWGVILTPLWAVYIAANPGDRFTRFVGTALLVGWLIYFLSAGFGATLGGGDYQSLVLSPGEIRDAFAVVLTKIREGAEVAVKTPGKAINDTKLFFTGQINYATQEYYTGTVDQTQGAPIGVFIVQPQPLYTKFRNDTDDIVVVATLQARTFSESLAIKNRCHMAILDTTQLTNAGERVVDGKVVPPTLDIDYTGEFQEKHPIDCTVERTDYTQFITRPYVTGATVVFNSTFDFETWGYAEYGFMDRQLVQSFRTENKNPADVMQMPMTLRPKYTPGPLMLGMPNSELPIPFDSESDSPSIPAFGVTFTNAWMGKGAVDSFESVGFYLPKPFKIKSFAECSPKEGTAIISTQQALDYQEPVDWSENPAYNAYTVRNVAIRDGESYITLRCPIIVDETQARQYPVLGTSGAAKSTFFVSANYTYSTWTRTPVSIQGVIP